jgi:hypothetical protein
VIIFAKNPSSLFRFFSKQFVTLGIIAFITQEIDQYIDPEKDFGFDKLCHHINIYF